VLLLLVSFIVLKTSPGYSVVKIMIVIVYGLSTLAGGYIMGKVMLNKKFLWGALSGLIYFLIIAAISVIVKGSVDAGTVGFISGFVVSVAAGCLGGMIS
jgi:putative membrane protein (TIGR04086 family)